MSICVDDYFLIIYFFIVDFFDIDFFDIFIDFDITIDFILFDIVDLFIDFDAFLFFNDFTYFSMLESLGANFNPINMSVILNAPASLMS